MAELDAITEALRRQRQDLEGLIERTSSRTDEAAELISRIEDLRRRSEETLRRFQATAMGSESRRQ